MKHWYRSSVCTIFRIPNVAIRMKFIRLCLHKLSVLSGSEAIYKIYSVFPDSLVKAQFLQNIDNDNFQQVVVCPKCFSTYTQEDLRGKK